MGEHPVQLCQSPPIRCGYPTPHYIEVSRHRVKFTNSDLCGHSPDPRLSILSRDRGKFTTIS